MRRNLATLPAPKRGLATDTVVVMNDMISRGKDSFGALHSAMVGKAGLNGYKAAFDSLDTLIRSRTFRTPIHVTYLLREDFMVELNASYKGRALSGISFPITDVSSYVAPYVDGWIDGMLAIVGVFEAIR